MINYYPVFLDLRGKECLVIGGGKVAGRKTASLLQAGACVKVISPDLTAALATLYKDKKINYVKSPYRKNLLKNAFLVIAATDDRKVNWRIFNDASRMNLPVNTVDSPQLCNFIVPAVLREKGLIIAVSTSGMVPALSRKIKEDLKDRCLSRYASLINPLKKERLKLKKECPNSRARRRKLMSLLDSLMKK